MLVGSVATILLLVPLLGRLNEAYEHVREARGLENYGQAPLEAVLVVSAVDRAGAARRSGSSSSRGGAPLPIPDGERLSETSTAPRPAAARASPGCTTSRCSARTSSRSASFYRDLLGMRLVERTRNPDDPNAEHLLFGPDGATGGTMVTCMAYPGPRGGLRRPRVDPPLRARASSPTTSCRPGATTCARAASTCTEVHDRGHFKSIYLRDPDGHLVEIATRRAESP